jgi:hypothetical protein
MSSQKSLRSGLILILLTVSIAACGSVATPAAPTAAPAAPTAAPAVEPPKFPSPSVAILVIDDFAKPLQPGTNDQPTGKDCIVTPDGLGYYTSRGATGTQVEPPQPHGKLVFEELQYLLTEEQKFTLFKSPDESEEWYQKGNQTIVLVRIDTIFFDTGQLEPIMDGKVKDLIKRGIKGLVLNMSFAIIPCDQEIFLKSFAKQTLQDSRNNGVYSGISEEDFQEVSSQVNQAINLAEKDFEEQLQNEATAKAVLNGVYLADKWQDLFGTLGEPLFDLLKQYKNAQVPIISVAAAGNSGFNFPFAPAILPSVLAVSATEDKNYPDFKSNSGEVQVDGTLPGHNNVIGSSFAAPRVSLLAALYLLRIGKSNCNPPFLSSSDGANKSNNSRLDCKEFPAEPTATPTSP